MAIVSDSQRYLRTRFDDNEQRILFAHVEGVNVGYSGALPKRSRKVSFWSFFHQIGNDEPRRVGPEHPSRESIVADTDRFGTEFGF